MTKLTRFEVTRVISARALQLALGAPTLVKLTKIALSVDEIAKKEIAEGIVPLAILREYPDGTIKRVEIGA